jgi:hypothetical protein
MKTRSNCDICDGSGIVRLPVRQRLSFRSYATTSNATEVESSRQYPCPECSESVKQEQLFVVAQVQECNALRPEFKYHAAKHAAREMVGELVERGYITLEVGQHDPARGTIHVRAKLGVVSPRDVELLEKRIVAHQETIAERVIDIASHKIEHYGSHSGQQSVPKSVARDALASSLGETLLQHERWVAIAQKQIAEATPSLSVEKGE